MKNLLTQLAKLTGHTAVSFGAFDPHELPAGTGYLFAPIVRDYLGECIPSVSLDLGLCRILSAADIAYENRALFPSSLCAPHGFITIATELNGDACALNVTDGKIHLISHEKYEGDGIHPGWNADFTGFLDTLPITRQNIIDTAEGCWKSITDFLQECLKEVEKV
jgi:hypothetical protein